MKDVSLEQTGPISNDEESAIDKMSVKELLVCIRELPDGYRVVFNLNVIEGYTHKEIGDMLNISENTSKSQLSRARSVLQGKLKNKMRPQEVARRSWSRIRVSTKRKSLSLDS